MERCEILIVGAGIAGTSLAYALARRGVTGVVVAERELGAAFHASGRSARTLAELDPNPTIQHLKALGAAFLRSPPRGFAPRPLIEPNGALGLLGAEEARRFEAARSDLGDAGIEFELLTPALARRRCEILDERACEAAIYLPASGFIDVDMLIASFVAHAMSGGVSFRFGLPIGAVEHEADGAVAVKLGAGRIRARTVVNAAGAWAGALAELAGCATIPLAPLRRSLALLETPAGAAAASWPLVISEAHGVYFRPHDGQVMFCPMDAEPCAPCDARPVAAVFEEGRKRLASIAPALAAMRATRTWAGLRTFSNDGVPVVGRDELVPSVFWLAGQAGCGIETCAIIAEVAADLLLEGQSTRFDTKLLAPGRFRAQLPLDNREGRA